MAADRELIRQIVERDTGAFDALFDRHYQKVRDLAARIVRDPVVAEDVAQEVFLRVWTRAAQYAGQGAVRAWLLGIARNLSLNELRSRRRSRHRQMDVPSDAADFGAPRRESQWMVDLSAVEPDALADLAERQERLQEMIQDLPAQKRKVYELVHNDDMNIREAAEELGIPVGTVKSRLHYARETLARQWQALQETLGDI